MSIDLRGIPIVASPQTDRNHSIKLEGKRLLLRNTCFEDLELILKLASDFCIAEMMNGSIPNPYTDSVAKEWIAKHLTDSETSPSISWAISLKESQMFIGSIQIQSIRR